MNITAATPANGNAPKPVPLVYGWTTKVPLLVRAEFTDEEIEHARGEPREFSVSEVLADLADG